jgi:hypothetical protein
LTIHESGKLDSQTGDFDTHASSISLNHSNHLLAYRNSKKDCKAKAFLAGAIDNIEKYTRTGNSEVFICPGTKIKLGWRIDGANNVQSAVIQPDGIVIPQQDYAFGSIDVAPTKTTEYYVELKTSECSSVKSSSVQVNVVEAGSKMIVELQPNGVTWATTLPPELYDPNIHMTSIQWVDCFSLAGWNDSLNVRKVDLDGTVHTFNASGVPSSPRRIQVAGSWAAYYPGTDRTTGATCFSLTVSC